MHHHILHAQVYYEFCVSFLYSWINVLDLNNPSIERLKYESPSKRNSYEGFRAVHWVPMPMGFGWAWVRYYCSWVGMGGHWFCASLHPTPNRSQTSRMQELRYPRSAPGSSQRQWTTFYLSDPTKTWCSRVIHITQFFEYMGAVWIAWVGTCHAMGGHGWTWVDMGGHRSLLMGMVWVWVHIRRKMLGSGGLQSWTLTGIYTHTSWQEAMTFYLMVTEKVRVHK